MSELRRREKYLSFFFLLPSLLIYALLIIYPLYETFHLSFYKFRYIERKIEFVGLRNYEKLLSYELFQKAIINTLVFDFMATSLQLLTGFALALIFNRSFKFRTIFLPLAILPMVMPAAVVCSIWKLMFDYRFGILNNILASIGLPRLEWLTDPHLAMISMVIVDTWQYTPFVFLVLLAGLQSIPRELYEAAMVDGASRFDIFKNITLPLLMPHIKVVVLLRIIDTFKIFTKPALLTGGGPGDATETLTLFFYKEAFRFFELGIGATVSVIMTIVVGILSLIYIKRVRL